ncbi:hypothetical protein, partial [Klebsiella pneumoniae]|uniref:hypothetical protein n=1 Tax=Klebsiella pneumoniae TaxID=573 RepID=UPI001D0F2E6E
LMMSLWDALRMNMMISYQELVRTFPKCNCLACMKPCGFFLPKEKAHRSGPYSYHHFLLGVVPGASR